MKRPTITYEELPISIRAVVARYVSTFLPNVDAKQLEERFQLLVTAADQAYAADQSVKTARGKLQPGDQHSDKFKTPISEYSRVIYYAACWAAAKIAYSRYCTELKGTHGYWQEALRNYEANNGAYKTSEEKLLHRYNLVLMLELIVACVEDLEHLHQDLQRIPSHSKVLTQKQLPSGLSRNFLAEADKRFISPAT